MGVALGVVCMGEGTKAGWLCVWLVCCCVCSTDLLFSSAESDFTALPML